MTHPRVLVALPLLVFLALAGCSAPVSTADDPLPSVDPDPIEEVEPTPEPAAPQSSLAHITAVDRDGYHVDFDIYAWGPLTEGAPAECALNDLITTSEFGVYSMKASGTISRPTVDGFTFSGPIAFSASIGIGYTAFNHPDLAAGVCGPGMQGDGSYRDTFVFTDPGTADFEVTFWYASQKTPNTPEGVDLTSVVPDAYLGIISLGGSVDCSVSDPSLLAEPADIQTCLIHTTQ